MPIYYKLELHFIISDVHGYNNYKKKVILHEFYEFFL